MDEYFLRSVHTAPAHCHRLSPPMAKVVAWQSPETDAHTEIK